MLPGAALEIIDSADLERVLAHARDCADCARRLGEYREAAAAFALALPRRQRDPDRAAAMRARLLTRAREDRRTEARAPKIATAISQSARAIKVAEGWLVAAILAVALVSLGVGASEPPRRPRAKEHVAR